MQEQRNPKRAYGSGSLIERNGDWYGKWRTDGRQVFRKVGPKRTRSMADGLTKAQAESKLRAMMAEVKAEDVSSRDTDERRRPGRYTIAEVAALYIAHAREHRGLKEGTTLTDYNSIVRNHLAPFFKETAVQRIDAVQIEAFARHLRTKKGAGRRGGSALSPKTVANYLGFLSTLLNFAVRKKWIASSPMSAVDLPAHKVIEQGDSPIAALDFLEPHEVKRLVDAGRGGRLPPPRSCALRPGRVHGPAPGRVAGPALGARRSGALRRPRPGGLHAGQAIEPEGQAAALRPAGADGGPGPPRAARILPLDGARRPDLRDALDRQADGPPRSWSATARPSSRRSSCRRSTSTTFGTTMARQGVPVGTIQAWMGHADLATTQLYMHYAPKAQDAAMIDAAFGGSPATNPDTNLRLVGGTEVISGAANAA